MLRLVFINVNCNQLLFYHIVICFPLCQTSAKASIRTIVRRTMQIVEQQLDLLLPCEICMWSAISRMYNQKQCQRQSNHGKHTIGLRQEKIGRCSSWIVWNEIRQTQQFNKKELARFETNFSNGNVSIIFLNLWPNLFSTTFHFFFWRVCFWLNIL